MILSGWFTVVIALCFFNQSQSLRRLPTVEENNIKETEAVIRNTTNELFATFNLTSAHDQPKIKQYSSIHKYFISLTLQDYNSLKEIAKLTEDDKNKIEIVIANYIKILNEILDEENIINISDFINDYVENTFNIDNEASKMEFIKNLYMNAEVVSDINERILKVLEEDYSAESTNVTSPMPIPLIYLDNDTVSDEESYWRPDNTDNTTISSRRIFGGHSTRIGRYPFLASVEFFGRFQCGSSIIKDDLTITAASCLQLAWNNRFYRENPSFLAVRVGSSYFENGGESVPIMEIYFYPSYEPRSLKNNLAIMRMVRHLTWRTRVKRIEFDTNDHPLPVNVDDMIIVGWGAMKPSNKLQSAFRNKLRYSVLNVYHLKKCQEIYSKEYVTIKHFCAGFINKGDGACNKDVGGPGIVGRYLTGVISFGAPVCGTHDAPTVFTKVGFYTDWIEEIMEMDVPESKQRTTTRVPRHLTAPTEMIRYNKIRPLQPINSHEEIQREVLIKLNKEMQSAQPTVKKEQIKTTQTKSIRFNEILSSQFKGCNKLLNTTKDNRTNIARKEEQQIFKEFLKTMFTSKEIIDYMDIMNETYPLHGITNIPAIPLTFNIKNITQETTESYVAERPVTRILNFDVPQLNSSDDEDGSSQSSEIEIAATLMTSQESTTSPNEEVTDKLTTPITREAYTAAIPIFSDSESEHDIKKLRINDDYTSKEENLTNKIDSDEVLNDRIQELNKHTTVTVVSLTGEQLKEQKPENTLNQVDQLKDSKERLTDHEAIKNRIDEAVISLLDISREKNKVAARTPVSNIDYKKEEEDKFETVKEGIQRDLKQQTDEESSSSDYESEQVELKIPFRSTPILEVFDDISVTTKYIFHEYPTKILPKHIVPKDYQKPADKPMKSKYLSDVKNIVKSEAKKSKILRIKEEDEEDVENSNNMSFLPNTPVTPFVPKVEKIPIFNSHLPKYFVTPRINNKEDNNKDKLNLDSADEKYKSVKFGFQSIYSPKKRKQKHNLIPKPTTAMGVVSTDMLNENSFNDLVNYYRNVIKIFDNTTKQLRNPSKIQHRTSMKPKSGLFKLKQNVLKNVKLSSSTIKKRKTKVTGQFQQYMPYDTKNKHDTRPLYSEEDNAALLQELGLEDLKNTRKAKTRASIPVTPAVVHERKTRITRALNSPKSQFQLFLHDKIKNKHDITSIPLYSEKDNAALLRELGLADLKNTYSKAKPRFSLYATPTVVNNLNEGTDYSNYELMVENKPRPALF